MKRKIISLALIIFSFIMVSCSNIAAPGMTLGDAADSAKRTVRLTVSSDSNLIDFTKQPVGDAKTITPSAVDSTLVNFYLGGRDIINNKNLPVQAVRFEGDGSSTVKGTINLELGSSNYNLTLIAILKTKDTVDLSSGNIYIESLLSSAVLAGYASADLIYASEDAEVNFYLTPAGLNGEGTYNLKLFLENWSTASKNATRYSLLSTKAIDSAEIALYKNGVQIDSTLYTRGFAGAFSLADAVQYRGTIEAGNYELVVRYTVNDTQNYTYSDDIKILATQETTAEIGIPDVIQNPPEAPSNFKQGYIEPSVESAGYYKLLFNWTDNSKSEQGFEIELRDETDNTANVTTTTANDAAAWATNPSTLSTFYRPDFYGSSSWYAGKLTKDSTFVAIYVPLGRRYFARIRAVSDAGASDWVYATSGATTASLPISEPDAENAAPVSGRTLTGKAFGSNIINLYKITYNLGGGAFAPVTVKKVYYSSESVAGTEILTPDGVTTSAMYNGGSPVSLSKNGEDWTKWKTESISGFDYNTAGVAAPNYTGFKDINFYAVYQPSGGGSPSGIDYSIPANIAFTVRSTGSGTNPTLAISDTDGLSVTRSGTIGGANYSADNLYFEYTYTTGVRYTNFVMTLYEQGGEKVGDYVPSANQFNVDISAVSPGRYTAQFKAFTAADPLRPYVYSVNINFTN